MKILLIFSLMLSFLNAHPFILTPNEKNKIKQHPEAKVIAKRFNRFYKFLHKAKKFDTNKKLIRTNLFINKIISKYDDKTNSWSTPKEFLINGFGDCEDYAITKYFTLQELGIKKDKLFLAVVKVKGATDLHMVLLYDKNQLLVLDNLSWKVMPLLKRKDLKFLFAFDDKHSYSLNNGKLIKDKKTKGETYFFKKLLEKIYSTSKNRNLLSKS